MNKSAALLGTMALLAFGTTTSSASATDFMFSFSGDRSNSASGLLSATANGDGTYTATSGTIIAVGSIGTGTGFLIANPDAPFFDVSPNHKFTYDDRLFPAEPCCFPSLLSCLI